MPYRKVSPGKIKLQNAILDQICGLADRAKFENKNKKRLPHKFHPQMVKQFNTCFPTITVSIIEKVYRKHCKAQSMSAWSSEHVAPPQSPICPLNQDPPLQRSWPPLLHLFIPLSRWIPRTPIIILLQVWILWQFIPCLSKL